MPAATDSPRGRLLLDRRLAVVLGVTSVLWLALFVVRIHAHQAFVDDYLYATVSRSFYSGGVLHDILHSGQTAPLVPALAMPLTAIGGLYGALAVELPILLLLVAGAFALARQWVGPRPAAVIALLVGLNCSVFGYSIMLNFALASTTALVWCFVAYLASDRLRDMRWSAVLGLAAAALLLSRTMALVYALPLAAVVGADLVVDRSRRRGGGWGPPAVAVGLTTVVAGPWWIVSGPAALRYLRSVGYQSSSGGLALSPGSVASRVLFEVDTLGRLQAWTLGLALAYSAGVVVCRRRALLVSRLSLLAAWAVVATLALSTSGGKGTGFGMPVTAVLIMWCGVVVVLGPRFGRVPTAVAAAALAAVVVAGVGATYSTMTGPWLHGPLYRTELLASGASPRTNLDQLAVDVSRQASRWAHRVDRASDRTGAGGRSDRHSILLAVNAPLLNYNGVRWSVHGTPLTEPTTDLATALSELPGAGALVLGNLQSTYGMVDQSALAVAAGRMGMVQVETWRISPRDQVDLWAYDAGAASAPPLLPETDVRTPKTGSVVHGTVTLVPDETGGLAPSEIGFTITGPGLAKPMQVVAVPTWYGPIGYWNSTHVPNGIYRIRAYAQNAAGVRDSSSSVSVRVSN